jgi:3-methyladenine DNA glycosylase/8-oxoguanine DNA glycosylase
MLAPVREAIDEKLTLEAPFPIDVTRTLAPFRHGPLDPTTRVERGCVWRALRTVEGPVTLRVAQAHTAVVEVTAWGRGRDAVLDQVPDMLGFHDDHHGFVAHHELIRRAHRRHAGVHVGRGGALMDTLVATVLEQKVTSHEAHRSWSRLVRRHGEPAPGPSGLHLAPEPAQLAALPYHVWHPLGVERRRADTVRRLCAREDRLSELTHADPAEARRVLECFPGVGPWTSTTVALLALGDRDAVVVGDYHLPHIVKYSLTGDRRGTDDEMLHLLEPYRGQRARAMRLLGLEGSRPPRRAPRARLRDLAAI